MNDHALKNVGEERRVSLSNIEPIVQRLCSLKQSQTTQKNHEVYCLH